VYVQPQIIQRPRNQGFGFDDLLGIAGMFLDPTSTLSQIFTGGKMLGGLTGGTSNQQHIVQGGQKQISDFNTQLFNYNDPDNPLNAYLYLSNYYNLWR